MIFAYMLAVFLVFAVFSSALAVTRAGATAKIQARGMPDVSLATLKIENGTARFGEKLGVIVISFFGAFISPLLLISSAIAGGILYAVFDLWLEWT